MVLPLSTVEHIGEKYIHFVHANIDEYVSLHQARTIDVRRFHSPMGSVDRDTFENIQKGMYTLYT
jgi:mRNA-degrading endonuclease toxin of MazEF toxin-antitoxin module